MRFKKVKEINLSEEKFAILRLFRSGGIGPTTFKSLIQNYKTASNALQKISENPSLVNKNTQIAPEKLIHKELKELAELGGKLVFQSDKNYPQLLKHISDAPPVISVLGNPRCLNNKCVAIVGNRNASANAMQFTEKISYELVSNEITIVSGLARGIDAAAHKGALSAGNVESDKIDNNDDASNINSNIGITIAVVAGGVNFIYPPEHKDLYTNIIKSGGAIISEMPLNTVPTNRHFPRRNRIVSGISQVTAVIEAPIRSGSLITTRLANEQGREVFAVPGSPSDPRAEGPNHLLKNGAFLLENAQDILDVIRDDFIPEHTVMEENCNSLFSDFASFDEVVIEENININISNNKKAESINNSIDYIDSNTEASSEDIIRNLLSSTPSEVDEIIQQSGLESSEVIIKITEMEILGSVERLKGGKVVLASQ